MKINKIIIATLIAVLALGCSQKENGKNTNQKVKVKTQAVEMLNYSA
ncbi:MAG: hypothetical protein J6M30_08610 [Bacteroidales bacterium]|nr:hypothetical protein [Bacteroidales bacterium]